MVQKIRDGTEHAILRQDGEYYPKGLGTGLAR